MKLAFVGLNENIVDAGLASPHQPFAIELPEFIPVRSKPLAADVVVLILKTHGDPVFSKAPQ